MQRGSKDYYEGLRSGLPIGIGYLSVSFAFGTMAVISGLSPGTALIISMTSLTSAGQFAGVGLLITRASYLEIILTMLMINARYFLMSLSLSQKLEEGIHSLKKALLAFGITDEVFTVASLKTQPLTYSYMLGLITLPYIGWALGTYLGAVTTTLLPASLQDALGIALYAMFIALILPAAKASKPILYTTLLAVIASCILKYVPILSKISSGFAVIIVTILAAGLAAYLFPIKEENTCI